MKNLHKYRHPRVATKSFSKGQIVASDDKKCPKSVWRLGGVVITKLSSLPQTFEESSFSDF